MSLIIDALKKTQKLRMGNKARVFTTNLPWFAAWQKGRVGSRKLFLLAGIALFIAVAAVYYGIYRPPLPGLALLKKSPPPPAGEALTLREISADSIAAPGYSLKEAEPEKKIPAPPLPAEAKAEPPHKVQGDVPQPAQPAKARKKAVPAAKAPPKRLPPPLQAAPPPQALVTARVEPESREVRPLSKPQPETAPPTKPPEKEVNIQTDTTLEAIQHFNVGLQYQKNNRLLEAVEEYKKSLKIDPANVEALNNLGVVYKDLGRREEAISQYQRALAVNVKYDKARHNLATVYYLQGDLDRAALEFHSAIESNAQNPESYNNLGLIYKKQKKFFQAKEVFRRGLSVNPNYSPLHYNLAIILEEEREITEAARHYRKFVELTPEGKRELIAKVKKHLESLAYHGK